MPVTNTMKQSYLRYYGLFRWKENPCLSWNPKFENILTIAAVISHIIPSQKTKYHQNILLSNQSLNITYKR
jgi:hypothetical protein